MTKTLQDKTALITGASSGLGADFARQLAGRGCHLVLVARRAERLCELQREISAQHPISIDCVTLDLTEADAPQRLHDYLERRGRPVDVLVNNAGLGLYGEFSAVPWESLQQMLRLNVIALTHLTRLFVTDMVERASGYVLLVASTGAFQPTPLYATYSAAKSYVLSLGEALHYELRQTGVHCTVLCPGVTRTEFHEVAGQGMTPYLRQMMMTSGQVVGIGIEAMLKGQSCVVAGRLNALAAWATRFMPRQTLAGLAAQAMRG